MSFRFIVRFTMFSKHSRKRPGPLSTVDKIIKKENIVVATNFAQTSLFPSFPIFTSFSAEHFSFFFSDQKRCVGNCLFSERVIVATLLGTGQFRVEMLLNYIHLSFPRTMCPNIANQPSFGINCAVPVVLLNFKTKKFIIYKSDFIEHS